MWFRQNQTGCECWQGRQTDGLLESELQEEPAQQLHWRYSSTFWDFNFSRFLQLVFVAESVMSEEKTLSYKEAIEKACSSISRFPLLPIRGIPLMCHIANNWDSIWAFRPDPSDLLIATYPKAGTPTLKPLHSSHPAERRFKSTS